MSKGDDPGPSDLIPGPTSVAMTCLPQVDGGRGAWTYLLCAVVLDAMAWGII
jgi:hypothetical protein